jgi:DNA-binding NtrC family response regulator
MSDTTGNTTSPPDPAVRRPASAPPTSTLAVAIAQSKTQPWRIGEIARPGPRSGQTLCIGREGAPFGRERIDGRVDTGRLRGDKLSREQLEARPEGDGARIHNVGNALVRVKGAELPRDCSAYVDLPAVIEIVDHYVLILMRRPLALPESHRLLEPLHPYGLVDRLGICGESPQAWQLRLDIARAAVANRNVIAFGESGTGKALVAHGVHKLSHRANLPFAMLSFTDLEHGTAALRLNGGPANWPNPGTPRTIGPFEAAKGGLAFLDELGEAPPEVQAILLTAFAGFYFWGTETTPRKVDCLIVAATNRPRSRIKHDLLHRIPTEIDVPSLAGRPEDLALIANHLLVQMVRGNTEYGGLLKTDETGREHVEVEPDLIVQLLRTRLPGNVRELEKLLGKIVAMSGDRGKLSWPAGWTEADVAPLDMREEPPHVSTAKLLQGFDRPASKEASAPRPTSVPPPMVDTDQRPDPGPELLLQTLRAKGWNKTATAAELGISREKVYRLMEKYGIKRPD